MKSLPFALFALPLMALVSCVDYTEEFTIKANGSGTIHSVISMKTELAKDDPYQLQSDLEAMFANSDGLSLAAFSVDRDSDRQITDFTVAFDHVKDLKSALANGGSEVAKYFGSFEAEEQDDRFLMKRTIDLSGSADSEEKSGLGSAIKKLFVSATMKDSYLTYRMTFPTEVLSANSSEIDSESNTVKWTFSVSEAVKSPLVMTAEISKPPLLKWFAMAGGALLVIVVAIVLLVRRFKSVAPRRSADETIR